MTHTVVWLLLSTAARLTIRRSALLGCNLLSALLCLVYLHVSFAGKGLVATVKYVSVSSRVIHCPFHVLCRGFPSANRGTGIHAGSAPRDPFLVAGCRGNTVYPPHTFVCHRRDIIKSDTCSDKRRTRAADPRGPPWSVPSSSVSALCHPSVPGCQQYCSLPSSHKNMINTHHQCYPVSSSAFGSSDSWGHQRRTSAAFRSLSFLCRLAGAGTLPLESPHRWCWPGL